MNVLSKNVHYLIHAHNILPDFPTDQSEASYVLMGTGLGHAYKPFTNFHIATQIDTSAGAKTVNISVQHNDSDAIPSYFKPGDRITLMARKTGSNDCYINYSADDFFLLACNNSTNTETIKENYVREFIFDGYKFVNVNDNC